MSEPAFSMDPDELLIDAKAARELGESLHESYVSAEPYPHICIDNVLPEAVLSRVADEVGKHLQPDKTFLSDHENLKSQTIPERLPFYTRSVFYALNARPFLGFLESMTGIKGLVPDPYFIGGGVHETKTGGFLDIHADFNVHRPLNLERRLNILLYLNPTWEKSFGGCLEIWNTSMTTKYAEFEPIFNRMVVFTTRTDTMHGNPEPVNHPEGHARRSMALYYYTATWDETRRSHSTIFKGRPGTDDASGLAQKIDRVIDDILPPILNRQVKKVRRRINL